MKLMIIINVNELGLQYPPVWPRIIIFSFSPVPGPVQSTHVVITLLCIVFTLDGLGRKYLSLRNKNRNLETLINNILPGALEDCSWPGCWLGGVGGVGEMVLCPCDTRLGPCSSVIRQCWAPL